MERDVTPVLMQCCSMRVHVCVRVCLGGLTLARLCKEGKREEERSDLHFKSPSSNQLCLSPSAFMILSLTLKVKTGFFFLASAPSSSLSLSAYWDKLMKDLFNKANLLFQQNILSFFSLFVGLPQQVEGRGSSLVAAFVYSSS